MPKFNPRNLKRNVVPDRLDLRDWPYLPAIAVTPAAEMRGPRWCCPCQPARRDEGLVPARRVPLRTLEGT